MGTGMIGMQWIIFIGIAVVSWLVQMNLQSKFKKYSKIPTGNGMTGADVALKMLHDNGIYDVTVTHTPGHLTDHYNPANKTVNLKELTNQSTRDLIRNLRLKQAASLLASKRQSINEVAALTGFTNVAYFSTAFKELYGMTPTAYMEQNAASASSDTE